MLSRRPFTAAALGLAVGVGTLLAPGPAYADYEHCDALGNCYWVVEKPGTGGGDNRGGGNNGGGRTDGYSSIRTCGLYGGVASQSPATWSADPPAGILPSYQELAQRAIAEMKLDGPRIGIAPRPNGAGLVGLPIRLWNNASPTTWRPFGSPGAVTEGSGPVTSLEKITAMAAAGGHANEVLEQAGDCGRKDCPERTGPVIPRPRAAADPGPTAFSPDVDVYSPD